MVTNKAKDVQIAQKKVGFGMAIRSFFIKYFTFSGVASRSEYWFSVLFVFLLWCLIVLCASVFEPRILVYGWLVLLVATFVPFLSLASRRMHDIGFSAKWLWFLLIPSGAFVLFLKFLPLALAVSVMYYVPAHQIYVLRCEWAFLAFLGLSVLMFVVFTLQSKMKNNRYRK